MIKLKKIKKKKKKDNINKIYNIAESFIDIMIIPNGKKTKKYKYKNGKYNLL